MRVPKCLYISCIPSDTRREGVQGIKSLELELQAVANVGAGNQTLVKQQMLLTAEPSLPAHPFPLLCEFRVELSIRLVQQAFYLLSHLGP